MPGQQASTPASRQQKRKWPTRMGYFVGVHTLVVIYAINRIGFGDDNTALLLLIASWLVAAALLMALYWPARYLFLVRPNRCPDCGYDLTGVPEEPDATCPDCGAVDPHYDSAPRDVQEPG